MNEIDVPSEVLESAAFFVEWLGNHFQYLGRYEGNEVFMYKFPPTMFIGYPQMFLLNPETRIVTNVTGTDALKVYREAEKAEEKES